MLKLPNMAQDEDRSRLRRSLGRSLRNSWSREVDLRQVQSPDKQVQLSDIDNDSLGS